jgi:hypothetical protein
MPSSFGGGAPGHSVRLHGGGPKAAVQSAMARPVYPHDTSSIVVVTTENSAPMAHHAFVERGLETQCALEQRHVVNEPDLGEQRRYPLAQCRREFCGQGYRRDCHGEGCTARV